MPCAVSCLASVSFLQRDAKRPPPRPLRQSRAVPAPPPLPTPPSPFGIAPSAAGSRAGGLGVGGETQPRAPGALVLTAGRLCLLHDPPPPSPAPRDAVWSPDAPPGGAHGPPGLPVHGQPRRATRPGPRGHGARPQASSAPARPEPGPEPGPAGAHRPRAEPQVSGGGGGGCPARRGRTRDPQGRGEKPGRRGVSREQASRV